MPGNVARLLAALVKDAGDDLRGQLGTHLTKRLEDLDHPLGQDFLLLAAAYLSLAAQGPVVLPVVEEEFVQRAYVAGAWVAGLGHVRALDVGDHALHLLAKQRRVFGDANDVAHRLRHPLLAISAADQW